MTNPKADGRVQRSERSRVQIVSAMLTLMRAGNYLPTAQQVADEAIDASMVTDED